MKPPTSEALREWAEWFDKLSPMVVVAPPKGWPKHTAGFLLRLIADGLEDARPTEAEPGE